MSEKLSNNRRTPMADAAGTVDSAPDQAVQRWAQEFRDDKEDWASLFEGVVSGERSKLLEFAMITDRLAREFPESNEGVGAAFITFAEKDTGPELLAVFSAAQVATIFVLLIACANVANLLLARATMHAKEAAVRSALGASRWRVMMPIFSEAAILSVGGAAAGIAIAFLGVGLFDNATAGVGKPYYMEFAVDPTILSFVVAITAPGEKIYEYAFFGACIKLRGATGAPMRPVAMPLRN